MLDRVAGDGSALALGSLIRRLLSSDSRDEILTIVSHSVRTLLQADGATFVLRDGDQCFYAEEDAISPLWKGRRFPMEACISGWCMLNGRSAAIPDIYNDRRIPADAYRPTFVRSLLMVPVGAAAPLGALGAYWAASHSPRPAELLRLQTIADAAALALGRIQRDPAVAAPPMRSRRPLAMARRAVDGLVASLRRVGLQPNTLSAYAFAVTSVAVATLVREGVRATGVEGLAVFSTFYPAVLVAVLFGGRAAGILAAVLGGLAAYYFFLSPLDAFQGLTVADVLNLALYGGASALIVLIIDWHQRALKRVRREDALHLTQAREQHHRTRNAASVVEAIVHQTLRDLPDRARTVNLRVRAGLDKYVPEEGSDELFPLRELLAAELSPYDLKRFGLEGEDISLTSSIRNVVSLAVHELATNALKHGALSVPEGRVDLSWRLEAGRAVLHWQEESGPTVTEPQRRGYGSVLLDRLLAGVGGVLSTDFPASGLVAELSLPLSPTPRSERARATASATPRR